MAPRASAEPGDLLGVLLGTALLLLSGVLLRTVPFPAAVQLLAGRPGNARIVPANRRRERIARCAAAMRRAMRILNHRPACLSRSLALVALLRLRGIPATVRIGVAGRGADLTAHAWVEAEDGPVGESGHGAEGYRPLRGAG